MIIIHPKAGLGNQMFIYAMGRALSLEKGEKLFLDNEWFEKSDERVYGLSNFCLSEEIDDIKNSAAAGLLKKIQMKVLRPFLLDGEEEEIRNSWKTKLVRACGVYMIHGRDFVPVYAPWYLPVKQYYGPFQSERYFEKCRDVLLKEFQVAASVRAGHLELIEQMKNGQSVCMHIRRGDYLKSPVHNVCRKKYFTDAVARMKELVPNPVFYVFSDDIEWCRENFEGEEFVFCSEPGNQDFEELRLMYNCKHFIIPNSTFSWWAQYLGTYEKKMVIAPDRWYNDLERDVTDIYGKEWIRLKVD